MIHVTDIINFFLPYKHSSEEAIVRGTLVHQVMEDWLRDKIETELAEPLKDYLENLKKFIKTTGFNLIAIEKPLEYKKMQLVGTPDLIGEFSNLGENNVCIVDIKTGGKSINNYFQLGAYYFLAKKVLATNYNNFSCYILYLQPDKWKLTQIALSELLKYEEGFIYMWKLYKLIKKT